MAQISPRSRSTREARHASHRARFILVCAAIAGVVAPFPISTAAQASVAGLSDPTLRAPVAPLRVVHLYDRPSAPWGPGHRGIDLAALTGEAVVSPGDGVVTFAGTVVDRGAVTVDHGGGLRSSVEPITPLVEVGDHVLAGDVVGVVSDEPGHCAPESCVHWGVRLGDDYVNPLDALAGYGRIVLLP